MGKYKFDEVIDRRGTRSTKWDAGKLMLEAGMAERFDHATIPVFTADMDFACPPALVSALHDVVNRRIFGYTMPESDGIYYKAVVDWHKRRYCWEFDIHDIIYVNGTLNAIIAAIETFTSEQDGIIVQKPVYGPFQMVIKNCKRKVVDNHLKSENGYYEMDFEDLERKLKDPKNTMLILCSPHNPVGRVWTMEELTKVRTLCNKNGVILVSDEMHADLVRKEIKFIPSASAGGGGRLITCTGISKTFNVAGLQCTNVIIEDPDMMAAYREHILCKTGVVTPTPFTVEALITAYTKCDDWLEELKDYLDGNIDFALDFLKGKMPLVRCKRPEGTYMLWLDFRAYGDADTVWKKISTDANVMPDRGEKYGESGYIRICIPVSRIVLKEILERIERAFR